MFWNKLVDFSSYLCTSEKNYEKPEYLKPKYLIELNPQRIIEAEWLLMSLNMMFA